MEKAQTLVWPLTPAQVEALETMLHELYQAIPATPLTPAQIAARVLAGL